MAAGHPDSELRRLPLEPQPDSGLAPDLLVATTAEDLAAGRDPELAAASAALRRAPGEAR